MNNITNVSHDHCTGCGACYNRCPFDAAKMELDKEGFPYPIIDNDKCRDCGLCLSACPATVSVRHNPAPDTYAVMANDTLRLKSSSGGMFSLLAEEIFKLGGAVCGARYSDDYKTVYHAWAENTDELAPLRGSKYVESDIGNTYRDAKRLLEDGRYVLYTGCPCQIAGLYSFLGKDYDKLYTADLICHGSNSITAYQSFIDEYSEGRAIEKVDFRDKVHYSWSTPTVMYFKDGSVKKSPWNDGKWYEGFLGGIINRECCYSCKYANEYRVADITLGDCWQVHRINQSYDDKKGTSLVLVNSDKGRRLFELARPSMKLCTPVSLDDVRKYNGQLNAPTVRHPSRDFFFSHLDLGYHKALWYGKGMRFDIGIVGWWFASNYGSSLTYFALASILKDMGKQILFIPIPKLDGTPWEPEVKQTVDFLSKRFRIGRKRCFAKMKEFNQFCDGFMVGSDQMWTPASTNQVGYTFFLDFVDLDKKKIAFATSFGKSTFDAPEEMKNTASDYLHRFDAISVREHSGVDVCRDSFGIEAIQVLDPVFLCKEEHYLTLTQEVNDPLPEKYLLCYILDPTPEKEEAVLRVAKKNGLEVLTILGMKEYSRAVNAWHVGRTLPKITTEQFLYYIKNADYVLTDSHHGVCMSIIFQKQYAALVNAQRGATRFEAVANALGLRDRLVYDPSDIEDSSPIYEAIDYTAVSESMEKECRRSYDWLCSALALPTKRSEETLNTLKARCNALEHDVDNLLHDSSIERARFNERIDALEKELAEIKSDQSCNKEENKKRFSLLRKRKDV